MVDKLMIPLSIGHFDDGTALPSDVFFRLHTDKYIQLGKKGQICHFRDLHLFKDKKAQTVYLQQKELQEFVTACLQRFQKIEVDADGLNRKFESLLQASDLVLKQFQHLGVTPETMESAKILTKTVHDIARQTKSVIELLSRFKGMYGNIGEHSICVGTISAMIAVEMGWSSEAILEKVTLGGLLHDVGLQTFPELLIRKSYLEMTAQERAQYETHPYVGAQMLRSLPSLPSEVISIVYEHHENSAGEGYPRRLDDSKINPLSKIVALANQFTELVMPSGLEEPLKPEQALNFIQNVMGQPFNPDCYKAFRAIFGKA